MNKDFENEYKNYAADNLPDLWSRIEAGIDEIEAQNTDNNTDETVTDSNSDNKVVRFSLKKYSGLIAAAACLVIAIPTIILISGSSSDVSNTTACADVACESAEPQYDYSADAGYEAESSDADCSEEAACEAESSDADTSEDTATNNYINKAAPLKQAAASSATATSDSSLPITVMYYEYNDDIENTLIYRENESVTDSYVIFSYQAVTDFTIINLSDNSEICHLDMLDEDTPVIAYLDIPIEEEKYAIRYTLDNNTYKCAIIRTNNTDLLTIKSIR